MDTHVLKLTGKVHVDREMILGNEYSVNIRGDVTSETISDNQDGTKTHYYKFSPRIADVLDSHGERLGSKNKTNFAQKLRQGVWSILQTRDTELEHEQVYEKVKDYIFSNLELAVDDVIEDIQNFNESYDEFTEA